MQPLKSLQASRAIAALMVVFFHLGLATQKYFPDTALLMPAGRAGVEYFFVLSGFIITLAHGKDIGQPHRLLPYFCKRALRIYPIYWLVFLITFGMAFKLVKISTPDAIWALLLLPAAEAPIISVAWSLQYEMVFYTIFGALIVHPILGSITAIAAWFLIPVLSHIYFLTFLAGAVAALLYRKSLPGAGRIMALAGALIFYGAAWIENSTGQVFLLWYVVGAFLIVWGLATAEKNGWVFGENRILQLLGNASYSIYLVHYPVISGVCKAAKAMGLSGTAGAVSTYLTGLTAAVAAGVAFHIFFESPLLRKLAARKPDRARRQSDLIG